MPKDELVPGIGILISEIVNFLSRFAAFALNKASVYPLLSAE